MTEVAIDPDLYESQLERLALLSDDLGLARRRWVAKRRPMVEKGSTGQSVPHSLLRVQAELAKQILALESELGLTLMSQRKAGRAVSGGRPAGAASAADRAQPPRRRSNVIAYRAGYVKHLTPDDAVELGAAAAAHAAECLLERGVDPDSCPRLLAALEQGVAQVVAARERGRDVGSIASTWPRSTSDSTRSSRSTSCRSRR